VIRAALAIVALTLAFTGCKKNIQTDDAVRQAILNHLSANKGLNVASMDIKVEQVTFRENEADATVSFKPKGGDAMGGMSMRYTLERKGNEWSVKSKADSGGMGGHGGAATPQPEGGALPPGHPPTSGGQAPPAPKK
jgi:hypothetical protein